MNKHDAAGALGISVRSLQRLVQAGKLTVTYRRGGHGKQEAVFDPADIELVKAEQQTEIVKRAASSELAITSEHVAREMLTTYDSEIRGMSQAVTSFMKALQKQLDVHSLHNIPIASKPLLKLDEAAALSGLSRQFLREGIGAGKLKAKLVKGAWRIKRPDLDMFIKKL